VAAVAEPEVTSLPSPAISPVMLVDSDDASCLTIDDDEADSRRWNRAAVILFVVGLAISVISWWGATSSEVLEAFPLIR